MSEQINQRLVAALEEAQAKMQEQQAVLERLLNPPQQMATVLNLDKKSKRAIIALNRQIMEIDAPAFHLEVGDNVNVASETSAIVKVQDFVPIGTISTVSKIVDNFMVEVSSEGTPGNLAYSAKFSGKLEVGDKVMLDTNQQVVIRNFGQDKEEFSFSDSTGVSWDDIGGLKRAKEEMVEAIELPFVHAELYKKYNKKPLKGVLLYGPPGCGKTMLGKATATSIAKIHSGKGTSTGFLYVKGPEILSKWVGEAEAAVRSLFERARRHKEKYGYPAVIFIDEADAILRKRGGQDAGNMMSTIVPAFLAEMDGLDATGAVVILATNRPNSLDNAVTRNGRIDRAIKVERPDVQSAIDIFQLSLRGVPLAQPSVDQYAKMATDALFSDEHVLYSCSRSDGKSEVFTLANLCNGAMIAGVVDQATSIAMMRDIKHRSKNPGIKISDIQEAVVRIYQQNMDLNHEDELSDFIEPIRDKVLNVEKTRQCCTV